MQCPPAAWDQPGLLPTTFCRGKTAAVPCSGPPLRDVAPDPKSSFSHPCERGRGVGRNLGPRGQLGSWRKKKPGQKFCRASRQRRTPSLRARRLFPGSPLKSFGVPAAGRGALPRAAEAPRPELRAEPGPTAPRPARPGGAQGSHGAARARPGAGLRRGALPGEAGELRGGALPGAPTALLAERGGHAGRGGTRGGHGGSRGGTRGTRGARGDADPKGTLQLFPARTPRQRAAPAGGGAPAPQHSPQPALPPPRTPRPPASRPHRPRVRRLPPPRSARRDPLRPEPDPRRTPGGGARARWGDAQPRPRSRACPAPLPDWLRRGGGAATALPLGHVKGRRTGFFRPPPHALC